MCMSLKFRLTVPL
uniref:Uncharacterized protein n=1 Tax=Anguilla anguilla TaxID=7936 RepID=A0A0E9VFD4_ANGAN